VNMVKEALRVMTPRHMATAHPGDVQRCECILAQARYH